MNGSYRKGLDLFGDGDGKWEKSDKNWWDFLKSFHEKYDWHDDDDDDDDDDDQGGFDFGVKGISAEQAVQWGRLYESTAENSAIADADGSNAVSETTLQGNDLFLAGTAGGDTVRSFTVSADWCFFIPLLSNFEIDKDQNIDPEKLRDIAESFILNDDPNKIDSEGNEIISEIYVNEIYFRIFSDVDDDDDDDDDDEDEDEEKEPDFELQLDTSNVTYNAETGEVDFSGAPDAEEYYVATDANLFDIPEGGIVNKNEPNETEPLDAGSYFSAINGYFLQFKLPEGDFRLEYGSEVVIGDPDAPDLENDIVLNFNTVVHLEVDGDFVLA